MDRALAQIAIPLVGIIFGAAAAAYFKERVGVAGAALCAALVLLAAAGVGWAYTFRFDWHGYSAGTIPPGYACDRLADQTASQCESAPGHCYPAPGALSGPGEAPRTGEGRYGYCVSSNPAISQNCAYPGELGNRFGQKMNWYGKIYECVTPGYWLRSQ